jgi:hypothetical protein
MPLEIRIPPRWDLAAFWALILFGVAGYVVAVLAIARMLVGR